MVNKMCCQRKCQGHFSLRQKYGSIITKAGEKTHGFNRVDDSLMLQVVK